MKKKNIKALTSDMIWLATMLTAFRLRFDDLGQEDPRVPERVNEMHEVLELIEAVMKGRYTRQSQWLLQPIYSEFKDSLLLLIDLTRNATHEEVADSAAKMTAFSGKLAELKIREHRDAQK